MIFIYILIIVFVIDYLLVNGNFINNYDKKIKLWFKRLLKK